MSLVEDRILQSIETKQRMLEDPEIIRKINDAGAIVRSALESGKKVLLCGNGGSASDSLHIAGELVGRFQKERRPLPALALTGDAVAMTALSNDYSYEDAFARQTEGLMKDGDVLIGLSTSGDSENVYRAIKKANEIGGKTIALLGKDGGKISAISELSIIVPSNNTARIQESHILIGHIICELVEEMFQ